jgi:hypothetical protein
MADEILREGEYETWALATVQLARGETPAVETTAALLAIIDRIVGHNPVIAERAKVCAEIRQLSVERGAEYRTPPCTNQGCPEVVGEHVHVLPFADLIGGGETGG